MARLYEDDTHDGYFYIYYNPSKQAAERERLELTGERMKIRLDKHIGEITILPKICQDYFLIRYDKKGVSSPMKSVRKS